MPKVVYIPPKSFATDPPVDPDFPTDYEGDLIETENEEISGSGGSSMTQEERARFRAYLAAHPLPQRDRVYGRKAE